MPSCSAVLLLSAATTGPVRGATTGDATCVTAAVTGAVTFVTVVTTGLVATVELTELVTVCTDEVTLVTSDSRPSVRMLRSANTRTSVRARSRAACAPSRYADTAWTTSRSRSMVPPTCCTSCRASASVAACTR